MHRIGKRLSKADKHSRIQMMFTNDSAVIRDGKSESLAPLTGINLSLPPKLRIKSKHMLDFGEFPQACASHHALLDFCIMYITNILMQYFGICAYHNVTAYKLYCSQFVIFIFTNCDNYFHKL